MLLKNSFFLTVKEKNPNEKVKNKEETIAILKLSINKVEIIPVDINSELNAFKLSLIHWITYLISCVIALIVFAELFVMWTI